MFLSKLIVRLRILLLGDVMWIALKVKADLENKDKNMKTLH